MRVLILLPLLLALTSCDDAGSFTSGGSGPLCTSRLIKPFPEEFCACSEFFECGYDIPGFEGRCREKVCVPEWNDPDNPDPYGNCIDTLTCQDRIL